MNYEELKKYIEKKINCLNNTEFNKQKIFRTSQLSVYHDSKDKFYEIQLNTNNISFNFSFSASLTFNTIKRRVNGVTEIIECAIVTIRYMSKESKEVGDIEYAKYIIEDFLSRVVTRIQLLKEWEHVKERHNELCKIFIDFYKTKFEQSFKAQYQNYTFQFEPMTSSSDWNYYHSDMPNPILAVYCYQASLMKGKYVLYTDKTVRYLSSKNYEFTNEPYMTMEEMFAQLNEG